MPIVPQRSPLPIDSTPLRRPLPGVRVIPNAPEDAFGPPALPNLTGVQQQIADIHAQETAKANQIAVNDADNKATSLRDQVLWGTQEQPGILAKKGQDAMAGVGDSIAQWNKGVGDIQNTLSNDQQKLVFQNRIDGYDHALHEQVQSHVSAERQRYDTETTNAYVQNRVNDAVQFSGNPQLSEESVDKAKAALTDYATRNGWSGDQLQEQQQKVTSNIRYGVIEKMVTGGQDLLAQQYLAAHNGELLPTQLEQAQRLTNASSVKGESQRQSDSIMGSATTLSDGLAQAAKINDPNVRSETEQRVRQAFSDKAASAREDRNAAYDRATAKIVGGGTIDDVPVADKLKLTPTEIGDLITTSNRLRHPVVDTAPSYYAHWTNVAGIAPQDFLNHDFASDRASGKVSESDFHYFTHLKLEMQNRETRADEANATKALNAQKAVIFKAYDNADKAKQKRDDITSRIPGLSTMADSDKQRLMKSFAPPSVPTIPSAWLDSAAVSPAWIDLLKLHHIPVDSLMAQRNAAASTPAAQSGLPKPKAPGGPME